MLVIGALRKLPKRPYSSNSQYLFIHKWQTVMILDITFGNKIRNLNHKLNHVPSCIHKSNLFIIFSTHTHAHTKLLVKVNITTYHHHKSKHTFCKPNNKWALGGFYVKHMSQCLNFAPYKKFKGLFGFQKMLTHRSNIITHHSITHHLSLKMPQLPNVACLALVFNFDKSKNFTFLKPMD